MTKFRVIHGDCVREMIRLRKNGKRFTLGFADPPFGIGHGYQDFVDRFGPGEYKVFTLRWVAALWDLLEPNGVMCLHGPDAVARTYIELETPLSLNPITWLQWHYRFGQCNRSSWIDARCHCLVYAKDPKNYTWNPDAVLVPSDRAAVYGDKRTEGSSTPGLRLPGTIWGVPSDGPFWGRIQGNSKERRKGHPNQLPEVYLERLIRAYTNPGDWVLDPACGSGTTATVAVALDRPCYTIDISEKSCESARKRIRKGPVRVKPLKGK